MMSEGGNEDILVLDEAAVAEVEELLPDGHEYVILDTNTGNGLTALLRIDLKSKEEILNWLEEYQQRNQITLKEVDDDEEIFTKHVYRKVYRCVQSTLLKNQTPSTECDAILKTTLKNVNIKNGNDEFLKTHPCEIFINHSHNHALSISTNSQFEQWFKLLFEEGHSPSSALIKIKQELSQQYGDDYLKVVPAAEICLCESWVNDYYASLYEEPCEDPVKEESSGIEIIINEYNDKCGDVCAVVNDQLTIAICSPLMKRNWVLISEVEEIIYVDSSDLAKHNMRIMLFLCPSRLGILPLGILLFPCDDEDEDLISEGIKLLKIILPENAKTPKLMIVADTNEEKCVLLKNSFNIENVLICKNYVQKDALKWLWDHKNHLRKAERINIYVTFIKTLNCNTIKAFESSYDNLQRLTSIPKNKKVFNYFENLKSTASLWATCYRKNLKYDSNDYSKIIFKVLLENNIPAETLNIVQLFAHVVSNFENYFFNRLTKIMNCDVSTLENTESWQGGSSSIFDCREIGDNLFSVIEETKINIVNRSIDYCTCSVNQNRVPCRHKWAIIRAFNVNGNEYPLANEELKKLIKKLLVDDECILKGWYDENEKLDQLNLNDEKTKKILKDFEPRIKEIRNKLENSMGTIMQKLTLNPMQFIEPVEKFISRFDNCKTNADLVKALETFGITRATASPIGVPKMQPNVTLTSGGVEEESVKIKPEKNLAPTQNSPANLVFKELCSNLVMENNVNDTKTNESVSVKKRKLCDI